MAKRPLKSYSIQIVGQQVEVEIITDRQKPYRYLICQDVVHPDIHEIARHLDAGLKEAKATFSKVGIVEYPERTYVSIELPIKYHSDRYTAHKRKENDSNMEAIFNIASSVFALLAAALWFRSATVNVKYDSTPGKGGVNGVALIDDYNNDILKSAALGNRWSKWAVLAASVAAACQSAALFAK